MTMPYYVPPEQLIKDRADFARKADDDLLYARIGRSGLAVCQFKQLDALRLGHVNAWVYRHVARVGLRLLPHLRLAVSSTPGDGPRGVGGVQ